MNKKNIVVSQNMEFYPDQIERLKKLRDVTFYKDLPKSPEEWAKRCEGADIVCSGKFGLKQKIHEMKNIFFSLPFVGIGWIDKEKIKKNNVTVASCPGCNKDAVSEWIIGMMINLLRNFPRIINNKDFSKEEIPSFEEGLTGKKVCILGKGNIGARVGKICKAFDMDVIYFDKGDNLIKSSKDADVIINSLSRNPTSINLLNKIFFRSLKKGSYFITVTSTKIYDNSAMLEALENETLAGVASDQGDIQVGDVTDSSYKKLLNHPRVLVTPHIAYNTDVTKRVAYDMMIDNIEAWINGKPINLFK